jgi:membrane dipeptidase
MIQEASRNPETPLRRAAAPLLIAWLLACGGEPAATDSAALHRAAIVVDGHADTALWFHVPDWRFDERHADGDVDLPRMREGGLDVQFWSIYTDRREGAAREALRRIDAVQRTLALHHDATELAATAADVRRIVARGKIASLLGMEGGHMLENDLALLRTYQRLGVRYLTLTHSFHTDWADSAGTGAPLEPMHHGLTDFGREVVREANRLGVLVDVSHVSDETFWDALETSSAPVIASHSSCRALAAHPRNLTDDQLRALAANGGVVMLNFYPGYIDAAAAAQARERFAALRPELEALTKQFADDLVGRLRAFRDFTRRHPAPTTSLEVLLDHFDHAIRVAGPDHVGLGADWDGVPSMPEGLDDVSRLPTLTAGLLRRGHAPDTVVKVLGANLLRALAQAERVAAALR